MQNHFPISLADFDKVCRTCLSKEEVVFPIFATDSTANFEIPVTISDLLIECTSVNVQPSDGLPSKLCAQCVVWLNRLSTFRRQCNKSDRTLKELLHENNLKVELGDDTNKNIKFEFCDEKENGLEFVEETYSDIGKIEQESDFDSDNGEKSAEENVQNKSAANERNKERKVLKKRQPKQNDTHQCKTCEKIFKKPYLLKNHMKTHSGIKPFSCDKCGKAFSTARGQQLHHRLHTGELTDMCPLCNKGYTSRSYLLFHIKSHHNRERPHLCNVCGRGFASPSALQIHMERHADEKSFVCETCNRGFNALCDLKSHSKIHGPEKSHLCTECGKGFHRAANLKLHMKTHTNKKTYQCNLCDKIFINTRSLKSHRKYHSIENPFKCSHCKKEFSQREHLNTHLEQCAVPDTS